MVVEVQKPIWRGGTQSIRLPIDPVTDSRVRSWCRSSVVPPTFDSFRRLIWRLSKSRHWRSQAAGEAESASSPPRLPPTRPIPAPR